MEIIYHTFIGGRACTIHLCIGVLYGCHLLVRYWRIAEEYWCFWYCIFGGLKWYLHQRYPRRCKPHQWKMLAHLPPGLPSTLIIDCIETVSVACYMFGFMFWLLHGFRTFRTSPSFMAQRPAEPKDHPRQWPSNMQSSTVAVIG